MFNIQKTAYTYGDSYDVLKTETSMLDKQYKSESDALLAAELAAYKEAQQLSVYALLHGRCGDVYVAPLAWHVSHPEDYNSDLSAVKPNSEDAYFFTAERDAENDNFVVRGWAEYSFVMSEYKVVEVDEPHLVEIQVHMEHATEKGSTEEMTTRLSEHNVKASEMDDVIASTKSTALNMAVKAAKDIHPSWFNADEVFLTTNVIVDGAWYDSDEGTVRLTDDGNIDIDVVPF